MSEEDELIAELVDVGALEPHGMDGDEFIYTMNSEIMKSYFPDLYDAMMADVSEALMNLYERGLVDVEYDENLNPLFSITEDGRRIAENMLQDGSPGGDYE